MHRVLSLLMLLVLIAGCQPQEPIVAYTVKKEHLLDEANRQAFENDASGRPDRMWGGIVFTRPQAWFFKVQGPRRAVQSSTAAIEAFVQSVKFENARPQWTAPAGWTDRSQQGTKNAPLEIPVGTSRLEMTVTSLALPENEALYLLENVNRWRGQMGEANLSGAELPQATRTLKTSSGETVVIVEMDGRYKPRGWGEERPFANQPPREPAAPAARSALPKLLPPKEWTVKEPGPVVMYAFAAEHEGLLAEITVTALPAARQAGEVLPNVNRWRDQIGLPALTAEELKPLVQEFDLGGVKASYVEFASGPPKNETLCAAMAVQGDRAWYFKLRGPSAAADLEKEAFKKFVQTTRFE